MALGNSDSQSDESSESHWTVHLLQGCLCRCELARQKWPTGETPCWTALAYFQ